MLAYAWFCSFLWFGITHKLMQFVSFLQFISSSCSHSFFFLFDNKYLHRNQEYLFVCCLTPSSLSCDITLVTGTHVYMENAMIQIFQKRKLVHFYINFSAYLSSHVVLRSCHIDMHPRVTTRWASSNAGREWSSAGQPKEALHHHTA